MLGRVRPAVRRSRREADRHLAKHFPFSEPFEGQAHKILPVVHVAETVSRVVAALAVVFLRKLARVGAVTLSIAMIIYSGTILAGGMTAGQGLSVDFRKESWTGGKKEVVLGTVHHVPPDLTMISVDFPVVQKVLVDSSSMTIYYPEEGTAIRLPSSGPLTLLFLQAFVGISDADFDLARLGFDLSRTAIRSDSLLTWWTPPITLSSAIGGAFTAFCKDRLAEVRFSDTNGKLLQRARFGEYVLHEGRAYPLSIELITYGSERKAEHFEFSNPAFGIDVPDSLVSLRLPHGVEIKDVGE